MLFNGRSWGMIAAKLAAAPLPIVRDASVIAIRNERSKIGLSKLAQREARFWNL